MRSLEMLGVRRMCTYLKSGESVTHSAKSNSASMFPVSGSCVIVAESNG